MLAQRLENRILIGITSFVAIMILVGWVAINEGGRMQAFERQFNARSVERGAALFANNCSICHGADARGILGKAPGLNNPQLFGYSFLEPLDTQIEALTEEMAGLLAELDTAGDTEERIAEIHTRLGTGSIAAELYALANPPAPEEGESSAETTGAEAGAAEATATPAPEPTAEPTPSFETQVETAAEAAGIVQQPPSPQELLQSESAALLEELGLLEDELDTEGLSEERIAEINARLLEINTRLGTGSIPAQLMSLANQRNAMMGQMQAAVQKGYNPDQPSRVEQLGWAGGLETFIYTTLVHGRPVSGQYWPQRLSMPPWSQQAGGPLRNDQLQDLTNYILNFDKGANWTLEDLFSVNQFAIIPGAAGGTIENPIGTDVAAILAELQTVTGDPQNGQTLYSGFALGCAGCHIQQGGVIAPALEGTWTRILQTRLADPTLAGYTPEQYAIESIVQPNAYTAPPYPGTMPPDFGTRLDIQMLADLIAYLQSQDGPSPE